MLKIKKIFNNAFQKVALVILAGLILFSSLPFASAQAVDFSAIKEHQVANANKNAAESDQMTDEYIESGKRAAQVIPKDLGTGERQKNPVNMLKRLGEELGNDVPKRVVGDNDYDRSPIEQELARNKAARGDFGK
jgi:hypothetical protein